MYDNPNYYDHLNLKQIKNIIAPFYDNWDGDVFKDLVDKFELPMKKDFMVCWMFIIGILLIIPFLTTIALLAMIEDFGGVVIPVFTLIIVGLCIASSFIFIGISFCQLHSGNDFIVPPG